MGTITRKEIDEAKITITDNDINKALEYPGNFGHHVSDDDPMKLFVTWSLGPVIKHRDSSILEESNRDAFEKNLKELVEQCIIDPEKYCLWECNHWAVGWVEHYSYCCRDDNGQPSNEMAFLLAWEKMLDNYPIADEDDFSEREFAFACEYIEQVIKSHDTNVIPEDYIHEIMNLMSEMPTENHGLDDEIIEAAKSLGYINEENEED